MGYMHIDNLYKNQKVLQFKECYALEKIHGTSAHLAYKVGMETLQLFSGGEKFEKFAKLFDHDGLLEKFKELFNCDVTVYGEAYGGKQQGMSETYGKELKFVVFDVKVGDAWVNVPNAADIASKLGLEFVDYMKVSTNLEDLDICRDMASTQAKRNGIAEYRMREGIVIRPLEEYIDNRGKRVMAKHKRDEFKETKTKREVSPEKLKVLEDAQKIADEWVTNQRLMHVLDKLPQDINIESTGKVINAMTEDVLREADGEIVESQEAKRAIGRATAKMFKQHLQNKMRDNNE